MLHKLLNEEADPQSTEQEKNSMEGSGSECSEAKASWTRKVYQPLMEAQNRELT